MEAVAKVFNAMAVESDGEKKLSMPAPECLAFLLTMNGICCEEGLKESIEGVYTEMAWSVDRARALSWADIELVMVRIQEKASAAEAVDVDEGEVALADAVQSAPPSAIALEAAGVNENEETVQVQKMVASLTADMVATITLQVEEDWKAHKAQLPKLVRNKLADMAPPEFAVKQFNVVMAQHVGSLGSVEA